MPQFRRHLATGTFASALAIAAAGPAAAELRAADVWQDFQDYVVTYGMSIEAGSEETSGDTLTATDVVMTAEGQTEEAPDASLRIPSIAFTENADGTVSVDMADVATFDMAFEDVNGPVTMAFEIAQPDLSVTVREIDGGIAYDYEAPTLTLTATDVTEAGEPVPLEMAMTMSDNRGSYVTTGEAPALNEQDFSASALSFDLSFSDETGEAAVTALFEGITSTSTSQVPEGVDLANLSQSVRDGFSTEGTFDFETSSYSIDVVEETGPTSISGGSAGGGGLSFTIGEEGLGYGTRSAGSRFSISGAEIPLPEVSATIARSGFDILFPILASEEAAPFRMAIRLEELQIDESLWGLFDPAGALDRSPWTLVLDMAGTATLDVDIMDPEATAAMDPNVSPVAAESLDVTALQLSVLGAELTGQGGFTFDNEDMTTFPGMPAPSGSLELMLTGANALMDQVAALGLVPEDQVMMGQMMLGMFATSTGEDSYESTVEIRDGGVFVNGTQVQ